MQHLIEDIYLTYSKQKTWLKMSLSNLAKMLKNKFTNQLNNGNILDHEILIIFFMILNKIIKN